MRKKVAAAVLTIALCGGIFAGPGVRPPAAAGEAAGPRLFIDGKSTRVEPEAMIMERSGVFVSLGYAARLGVAVAWEGDEIVISAGRRLRLRPHDVRATLDGATICAHPPVAIVGGRVFVPLELLADAAGWTVGWSERFQALLVSRRGDRPPLLTVAAVGDVLFDDSLVPATIMAKEGPGYPFSGVADLLGAVDIAFCNLECALSAGGSRLTWKDFTFRGKPEHVEALVRGGIDIVSVANNHTLDYGRTAFLDTLETLEGAGIAYAGGGRNAAQARAPAILRVNGLSVAFLACTGIVPSGWPAGANTPGVATSWDVPSLLADVRQARARADLVFVSLHWGIEYDYVPQKAQRDLARMIIDAGADAILGHHPHCLQGIEIYRGKPILYSLGNFVFPTRRAGDPHHWKSRQTYVAWFDIGPSGINRLCVHPALITLGRPALLRGSDADSVLDRLASLSRALGTNFTRCGDTLVWSAE